MDSFFRHWTLNNIWYRILNRPCSPLFMFPFTMAITGFTSVAQSRTNPTSLNALNILKSFSLFLEYFQWVRLQSSKYLILLEWGNVSSLLSQMIKFMFWNCKLWFQTVQWGEIFKFPLTSFIKMLYVSLNYILPFFQTQVCRPILLNLSPSTKALYQRNQSLVKLHCTPAIGSTAFLTKENQIYRLNTTMSSYL